MSVLATIQGGVMLVWFGCDFDIFHETRWCDVGVTWVRFGRDFGATSISSARQWGVICVWLGRGVGTMLI